MRRMTHNPLRTCAVKGLMSIVHDKNYVGLYSYADSSKLAHRLGAVCCASSVYKHHKCICVKVKRDITEQHMEYWHILNFENPSWGIL